MQTLKLGNYYKIEKDDEEVIAYYYKNTDMNGVDGFGFNIADGGGFLPLYDLLEGAKYKIVSPVEFRDSKSDSINLLHTFASDHPSIKNVFISATMRDNRTVSTFINDWQPVTLIGEVTCGLNMLLKHDDLNCRKELK